jgi:hypothetical protein
MGRNVVTKQSQIEGGRSHLWDPAMAERVLRKNQVQKYTIDRIIWFKVLMRCGLNSSS